MLWLLLLCLSAETVEINLILHMDIITLSSPSGGYIAEVWIRCDFCLIFSSICVMFMLEQVGSYHVLLRCSVSL